jgi:signal-transduction protein with cAMP-binding, CBS, and nucleotidyltransferase domain
VNSFVVKATDHSMIFDSNMNADAVYFIAKGKVEILNANGELVCKLNKLRFFGCIGDQQFGVTARALTSSLLLLELKRKELEKVMSSAWDPSKLKNWAASHSNFAVQHFPSISAHK